jgi:hypothetical protein
MAEMETVNLKLNDPEVRLIIESLKNFEMNAQKDNLSETQKTKIEGLVNKLSSVKMRPAFNHTHVHI